LAEEETMKTLITRAITGLIFATIMIVVSYFELGYIILMALITAFCTNEYFDITKSLRDESDKIGKNL
jgi:hypothetical protein